MRKLPREIESKIHKKIQTRDDAPVVSLEITRPKMPIQDSGYWTVEEIRTLEGVGDVAVAGKREKPFGRPTMLYEIHTENGIVKTAFKAYPDFEKRGWIENEIIEPGTSVAICFEADFHHHRKRWRASTKGEPFVFWIDANANLKMKRWGESLSLAVLVAENAKSVAVIRAWKNASVEVDLGMIIAYVKTDNKVYYKQLINNEFSNEFELEQSENTKSVSLMLTNDYRVGFVRTDSTGTTYHLTRRYWSGMAIERHAVDANVSVDVEAVRVTHEHRIINENVAAAVTASVVAGRVIEFAAQSAINELFTVIKVFFTHNIGNTNLEEVKNSISLRDSKGKTFSVTGVSISENTLTIISGGFDSVNGYLDIKFSGQVLYAVNDSLPFYLAKDTVQRFMPVFPTVKVPVTEKIDAQIAIDIATTQVSHNLKGFDEKINAQVSASIELTKTGTSPL